MPTETLWVYPPNWNGYLTDHDGWKRIVLNIIFKHIGDNEVRAKVLDISSLQCTSGKTPIRTVIEKIMWDVHGSGYARLEWDRAGYPMIKEMSGQSDIDLMHSGGMADPGSSGDRTGDILISADASYDITIQVRLKDK